MAATTATATTPLPVRDRHSVFTTLDAIYRHNSGGRPAFGAGLLPASREAKDDLRRSLDAAQGADDVVLLVRRYFNTLRTEGVMIVAWQVWAAERLLTISTVRGEAARRREARRLAREQYGNPDQGTAPGHGSRRCLTEATDGECVCR